MPIDYEVEYDNRARVPEHPEIFARWLREGAAYRAAAHNAKLGLTYGPSLRRTIDLFRPGRRQGAARHVHPWRLVALARAFDVFPAGGRTECARHHGRGHGLRSLPARVDRRHHRANSCGLSLPLAQTPPAHFHLWSFRRRPSCGLHGRDRLEKLSPPTRRPISCPPAYAISGVFDLLPLVHVSQNQDLRLDDAEARARVAAVLARPGRPRSRCSGWLAGIGRVSAPEQNSRRNVAARHGAHALRGNCRRPIISPSSIR